MVKHQIGDKVVVAFAPTVDDAPGWPRANRRFTGTVRKAPDEHERYYLIRPDDEFHTEFSSLWFAHPDWVSALGGPW